MLLQIGSETLLKVVSNNCYHALHHALHDKCLSFIRILIVQQALYSFDSKFSRYMVVLKIV